MDQLGLSVAPGTGANKDGVVVTNVDNASDAAQKGIKSGDVILEIGTLRSRTRRTSPTASRRPPSSGARPC